MVDDPVLEMVPPPHMWEWVGEPKRFVKVGRAMFDHMVEHAELTPASAVLDVGCGIGKHAIHFAPYLRDPGFYEGFDVEERSIGYCQEAITSRYPHIRFRHVDVQSAMYSPSARGTADRFRFPYPDATFDFVFLASVLSHMFFADVAHYVSEIVRVLKPGGRMLATGYWLGDAQRAGIAAGTAAFTFGIAHQGSFIERPEPADSAVAQPRAEFLGMLGERGLEVVNVRDGLWPTNAIQDQDFVLCRKPNVHPRTFLGRLADRLSRRAEPLRNSGGLRDQLEPRNVHNWALASHPLLHVSPGVDKSVMVTAFVDPGQ